MTTVVLLDSGPLGMVTHPKGGPEALNCKEWLKRILTHGLRVVVPGISDYEVRRELERSGKMGSIWRLDALAKQLLYLPLNQDVMREAARLWAEARWQGKPTAPDHALDGDCILAAQARLSPTLIEFTREERVAGIEAVIATTNVGHLSRYANARHWADIKVG